VQTFDDLTVYLGANELSGQVCDYLTLAVNNASSSDVYIYDATRFRDLGRVDTGDSALYEGIVSGTQIEVRTAANRGGALVDTSPPTPVILAGQDATINLAAAGGGSSSSSSSGGNNGGGNGGGIGGGVGGGQNHQ